MIVPNTIRTIRVAGEKRKKGEVSQKLFYSPSRLHLQVHLNDLALGKVPLTCGCFCVRGLIHHKPFWKHHAKPATFLLEAQQGQTTTPGTPCLFEQCVGSFTSRRVVNNEELRDRAYS